MHDRVYVYTDRQTNAVLFIVEAVDVRTANGLLIKHCVDNKIELANMSEMDVRIQQVIKEKK